MHLHLPNQISPGMRGLVAGLVTLAGICVCVLLLSYNALDVQEKNFRAKLALYASHAAALVPADKHQQLSQSNDPVLYDALLQPLVVLHKSIDEITYLYTMIERDGQQYFVLDTAFSTAINRDGSLEPSGWMELYDNPGIDDAWVATLRRGHVYLDPELVTDDFGTFISVSAPIMDASGKFVGWVGVDVNASDYAAHRQTFQRLLLLTLGIALLVAIAVGLAVRKDQQNIRCLQQAQERLSHTDALTGAYNRRFMKLVDEREWYRYTRRELTFALIALDIDHFKQINDNYGHDAGDACLVQFTQAVESALRKDDILVRMGGEEFLVFLSQITPTQARTVAERIRGCVAALKVKAGEQSLSFTVSLGLTTPSHDDDSMESVMRRADEALYQAKAAGRDQLVTV